MKKTINREKADFFFGVAKDIRRGIGNSGLKLGDIKEIDGKHYQWTSAGKWELIK